MIPYVVLLPRGLWAVTDRIAHHGDEHTPAALAWATARQAASALGLPAHDASQTEAARDRLACWDQEWAAPLAALGPLHAEALLRVTQLQVAERSFDLTGSRAVRALPSAVVRLAAQLDASAPPGPVLVLDDDDGTGAALAALGREVVEQAVESADPAARSLRVQAGGFAAALGHVRDQGFLDATVATAAAAIEPAGLVALSVRPPWERPAGRAVAAHGLVLAAYRRELQALRLAWQQVLPGARDLWLLRGAGPLATAGAPVAGGGADREQAATDRAPAAWAQGATRTGSVEGPWGGRAIVPDSELQLRVFAGRGLDGAALAAGPTPGAAGRPGFEWLLDLALPGRLRWRLLERAGEAWTWLGADHCGQLIVLAARPDAAQVQATLLPYSPQAEHALWYALGAAFFGPHSRGRAIVSQQVLGREVAA